MAMAEEFINDNSDDRLPPDAEAQIEATLFKQGQEYAARNLRSKTENKGRAESRAAIKSLGMNPNAYATAIKLIKDLTQAELKEWRRDFDLTIKVMGSRQRELFPSEQLAAEARIQRAKDKAAKKGRTQSEMDADSDVNPRSDPNAGGAQIDLEAAIAEATARELAEGEALLAGKSDAWRAGYNSHSAGGERGSNPYLEGSAETRDWLAGYEVATQRAFDAAQPKAEPVPDPVIEPGATFNDGWGKPAKVAPAAKPKKPSQSEKAKAKRDAAQVP